MRKILSLIIMLFISFNLMACGSKATANEDPIVGMWNAFLVTLPDDIVDIKDMYQKGISLELKSNGNYTINWDGAKSDGKWSNKDGTVVISRKDGDFTGTIVEGVLTLVNVLDLEMDVAFEKEGGYAGKGRPDKKIEAGYYVLEEGTEDGEVFTGDEMREMGMDYYVVLNEDGTAQCQTDEMNYGTWEKGALTLNHPDLGNKTLDYIIDGDKLTIDWDGLVLMYLRSNETPPSESLTDNGMNDFRQWWDGEWYGYWETHSETDLYKDFEDGRWECFGLIELNEDDTAEIYLWDPEEDFAHANITITEVSGQGSMGAAKSNSGNLWFGSEIENADWIIDPSIYGHDDYMVIDGRYVDEFGGGFNYEVYLKPWGEPWDDFTEDEKPPFYDTWYLSAYKAATMWEAIYDRDAHIHSEIPAVPEIGNNVKPPKKPDIPKGPVPVETAPSVPAIGAFAEVNYTLGSGAKVYAMLPQGSWIGDNTSTKAWLYNVPTLKDAYSNSPRIMVEINSELAYFDLHKAEFENLQNISNRTIGGIDMVGRSYKFVGMDWIEYTGVIDEKNSVSVRVSKVDVSSGEGSAVLDSLKFTK